MQNIPSVVPVYDHDLEAAMLNRLINERQAPLQVLHLLSDDCFHNPDHLTIFHAIKQLNLEGKEIDMLTVSDLLRNTVESDKVQSCMYNTAQRIFLKQEVMELFDLVNRLQEYATRRKIGTVVSKLMTLHSDMTYPLQQGIREVQDMLNKTVMGAADSFVTLSQKLDDLLQVVDDNLSEESRHTGLLCGLPQLDVSGGLPSDGLVVIGAKSSHGKTTFATNVALHALKAGRRIAFYSLEMSMQKVTSRILSMECGISSNTLQRLRLTEVEHQRVIDAVQRLKASVASQFYFDNRSIRDVDSLVMSVRALKKAHDVDCIVVDYLQLMDAAPGTKVENTNKLLGSIAHRLHDLAQDLHITILLLSQINRSVVGEPFMAHLRDSGEIAEAADMVIILYNADFEHAPLPRPFDRHDAKGLLLVKVEKNRDGATTSFLAGFNATETRIYPYDPDASQKEKVEPRDPTEIVFHYENS